MDEIEFFVRESNRIEAILRPPTKSELKEAKRFLDLEEVTVYELKRFVSVYEPIAKIRDQAGMNVMIGTHIPIHGGTEVIPALEKVLAGADRVVHPYKTHLQYEMLHPFMDCNGRSGRILWAWQMLKQNRWGGISYGFLHPFYYQALQFGGDQ